ncbi:MAG TPA: PrsW family glutamic-type intramembrane protease [Methanoregulaceae archaeon]|nr:PrsW family glutamic-type intramembrane protease [Methanoregulaceae archaeon]
MLGLLALAIAPAVFVLCYFYLKDRYEPEPLGWVIKVFFIGAFMVIPAALLEAPFPEGLFVAVIVAPIVEEFLKFAAVYFTVYRDEEFDEPVDGIVYGVAAALGFAMVENIMYVLEGGLAVGIVRAIASVPAHALFASVWGYTLGLARFRPEKERPLLIASGLAAAMVFHGVFNLLASDSEIFGLIVMLVLLIPFGWWIAHRHINKAHDHPDSALSKSLRSSVGVISPTPVKPAKSTQDTSGGIPSSPLSQNRFCTACRSPVSPTAKYCRACGEPIDRE